MQSMRVATEVQNDEVQSLGTTQDQENKRGNQIQDFDNLTSHKKKMNDFDKFHSCSRLQLQILTHM